jgi:hypothetical protein
MQYYYHSHIRNLEDEALLEKQKISAELHERRVIKEKEQLADSHRSAGMQLKRSRRDEDRETAAYL